MVVKRSLNSLGSYVVMKEKVEECVSAYTQMAVESTHLINFHILRVLESGGVIPDVTIQKFVYSVVSRVAVWL